MPTLNEFAHDYALQLRSEITSPTIVPDIAKRIRGLTYTKSGKPLSDADTEQIVKVIETALTTPNSVEGGGMLKEAEDSSKFIAMVNQIRNELRKK